MTYKAPIEDISFLLNRLIGFDQIRTLDGQEQVNEELCEAVLTEASKIASEVFAPLNSIGDKTGIKLDGDQVRMPPGFKDAYAAYINGGWSGLSVSSDFGGQGLPSLLAMAVQEMLQSANLSLALCPLLNQGSVELLASHGSDQLKSIFLKKLVSGEWSGTMNLTESDAGSDVGAVKCRAVKENDVYRITGQKIFISYGDHDLTSNIIHFVLARIPGSPEGTKGLSLFLVPKILVKDNGNLGEKNDLRVVSVEHKLGQHASPTCVMAYGDNGGALGYLVGRENGGIAAMFTMMNNARIGVGVQGLALMERAYQQAYEYASSRVQGRALDKPKDAPVTIINHPDVKRMILTMKALTEAARALAYSCAWSNDQSKHDHNIEVRKKAFERVDLLTPVVKAWLTDLSNEITSLAIQVYGGMGYIEETGVAQYSRDARVLAIYEGTNGIQANDLIFRKILRDKGVACFALVSEIEAFLGHLGTSENKDLLLMHSNLVLSIVHLKNTLNWILEVGSLNPNLVASNASIFLRLVALVFGGYYLIKSASLAIKDIAQNSGNQSFLNSKVLSARFYAVNILPLTQGLSDIVVRGSGPIAECDCGKDLS